MLRLISWASFAALGAAVLPASIDIADSASIKGVAKTLATGTMSYYPGTSTAYADLPGPYYWWELGALMGAMADYGHYTNDNTYDLQVSRALASQVLAPDYDLMVPAHYGDEGNDDQSFWAFGILAAAERNLPNVGGASTPSWLQVAENAFNTMSARWNTTACGGGLAWQIFPSNPNGITYRNSVSNGGLFQISARLYRATGNVTYANWATKVWDWTTTIGLIDEDYNVFDGTDARDNCTTINHISFSYTTGIFMYGAAVMANATNDQTWVERTMNIANAASSFYGPYDNSTDIMFEHACETVNTCNTDMLSFKGYLSRFTYKSAVMVPSITQTVFARQNVSVLAAAKACTGGTSGTVCGEKWYVGGYDGTVGLGQQMGAMETIQGLLAGSAAAPLKGADIKDVRVSVTGTTTSITTGTISIATPIATPTSSTMSKVTSTSTSTMTASSTSSSATSVSSTVASSAASSSSVGSSTLTIVKTIVSSVSVLSTMTLLSSAGSTSIASTTVVEQGTTIVKSATSLPTSITSPITSGSMSSFVNSVTSASKSSSESSGSSSSTSTSSASAAASTFPLASGSWTLNMKDRSWWAWAMTGSFAVLLASEMA